MVYLLNDWIFYACFLISLSLPLSLPLFFSVGKHVFMCQGESTYECLWYQELLLVTLPPYSVRPGLSVTSRTGWCGRSHLVSLLWGSHLYLSSQEFQEGCYTNPAFTQNPGIWAPALMLVQQARDRFREVQTQHTQRAECSGRVIRVDTFHYAGHEVKNEREKNPTMPFPVS